MQAELELAIADFVLGDGVELDDPDQVRAWLSRNGVAAVDCQAILESSPRRWRHCRERFRAQFKAVLRRSMPRVLERLGEEVFEEYFDMYLRAQGPRTHNIWDVPSDFLQHCESLWAADSRIPDYMLSLARHEAVALEVQAIVTSSDVPRSSLELDKPVRMTQAARLMVHDYAVHEVSDDLADRDEPERRFTALLAYRDAHHDIRYVELSPLAALIVRRLLDGNVLGKAVLSACREHGTVLDGNVIDGAARLLADLAERGVVLGAAGG